MYNIKLEDYVPAPKPATTDRIVAAHYYAAWKKGAAELHNGFDDLHDFPERTPLMGYYDEENPAVTDFEIKWALEHGINCFIYCWYRRAFNEGHPVTDDALRCCHGIHEGLFKAKYGHMMKFAIMYENTLRWSGTNKKDLIENLMPYWTETYFKRENYLKFDNKPVLLVCDKNRLNSAFSSVEEQNEVFDLCREYAKSQGFEGLLIAACTWERNVVNTNDYLDTLARGYDFLFPYNSGYAPEKNFPPEETVIEKQCEMLEKRLAPDPMRHIPIASCMRDATPRTTEAWKKQGYGFFKDMTIFHLSPEGYRETIRRMKKRVDALPDGAWGKRMFIIDNWNEWDEGHYVSPSHEYGFGYLQAIREELTKRDNLPDYRMPRDLGITNLNSSWEEPDLSEICKKKFNLK